MKTIKNLKIFLLAGVLILAGCTKEEQSESKASKNPVADKLDPEKASGNTVLTLTGSGLGGITSVVFEKGNVPAPFNPTLNTDRALIFRVPDTANGGAQNIILTNRLGAQLKVPFNVVALPLVNTASNYNFIEGTEITLVGNNLQDVTSITIDGTAAAASIVTQSKKELVIKMPATTVNSAKLVLTNSTGPITTNQVFVNLDKAYKIFTDDYGNGFENGSWGPASISSAFAKSGTKSFKAGYNKGNWSADGFANWNGVASMPEYNYLSFWVKGASADYTLYVTGDARAGGYGNSDRSVPIAVPANVWTYFKIPMTTLELWKKGPMKQLGFWIEGPEKQDEAFYFDDVILVK
ncbi:IPT/TIG domain-containing protein [Pedobacter foliorum]|uniref:IPT/TIG domain-containing protein n=1 Tax=Pedobacter foliorum TaxID=2739058 RepID=UPI0015630815|nr:IPT/TIG domain-containing protein [Pedobacter foliorum]NRF40650.1 IPT/TIG domain-containing protein [Pedobacter foliorum]